MNRQLDIAFALPTGSGDPSGGGTSAWRGHALRQQALTEILGTLDDAVEWLRRQRDLSGPSLGTIHGSRD